MALLREQRVSQGDNVKPLCELRPNGARLWQWVHLAEVAHAQLLAKRAQGDEEARLGMPISPFYDREKTSVAQCQMGFINVLVKPLYVEWHKLLGEQVLEEALEVRDVLLREQVLEHRLVPLDLRLLVRDRRELGVGGRGGGA